jgi:hypothetical protein
MVSNSVSMINSSNRKGAKKKDDPSEDMKISKEHLT